MLFANENRDSLICFAQFWRKHQVQFTSFASPVMRKSASGARRLRLPIPFRAGVSWSGCRCVEIGFNCCLSPRYDWSASRQVIARGTEDDAPDHMHQPAAPEVLSFLDIRLSVS